MTDNYRKTFTIRRHSNLEIQTELIMRSQDKSQNQVLSSLINGITLNKVAIRSLCCSGLANYHEKIAWSVLQIIISSDEDSTIRSEALASVIQHSLIYGWDIIRQCFIKDSSKLVRVTLLSTLLEQGQIPARWLIDLSKLAVADNDNNTRKYGVEIFGRLNKVYSGQSNQIRQLLVLLQNDHDVQVATLAMHNLCL